MSEMRLTRCRGDFAMVLELFYQGKGRNGCTEIRGRDDVSGLWHDCWVVPVQARLAFEAKPI